MEMRGTPESKENHRVVRAFMVQSKSIERLKEEYKQIQFEPQQQNPVRDIRDLFLTKVVLAEKSEKSEKNPGQVMPTGGHVASNEKDLVRAMLRKILEETHLRPVSLRPMETNLKYTLDTSQGGIDIDQKFFIAKILPSDYAYPLDPEEDKIASFHGLDLGQLGNLYATGHIENEARSLSLLGSMRLPLEEVASDPMVKLKDEYQDVPMELFGELTEKLGAEEIKKREQVRKIFFETSNLPNDEKQFWNRTFQAVQDRSFFDYQNVWKDCLLALQKHPDFEKHFFAAVDVSNFEEEITGSDSQHLAKESKVESVMRFIYTLLNTHYDFDEYFDVAEKNDELRDFVQKIKKFLNGVSSEEAGEASLSQSLSEKAKYLQNIDEDLLADEFCSTFHLNVHDVGVRLARINKFITGVVEQGITPQVGMLYHQNKISPYSEVSGSQLGQLIKYAFSVDDPSWSENAEFVESKKSQKMSEKQKKLKSLNIKKRLVFEARRNIALLVLFKKVDDYYYDVMNQGMQPFEKIKQGYVTFPQIDVNLVSVQDENGHLQDVLVFDGEQKELPQGVIQQTTLRSFKRENSGSLIRRPKPGFLVGNEIRTKQMDSVYRKIIVRGFDDPKDIQDIYGRSLLIVPEIDDSASEKYVYTREERVLQVDGEWKSVNDFAPILDIIEYYTKQPGIKVFDYKPTPEFGQKTKSSGVGGGEIRVSKFYLEHTDSNGIKRYEEVQVFCPSEDGKTALYWEKKKKEDDKRYFLDRMLETKGLRSFLELMFPTTIYGEPMYAMKKNQKERKRKKSKS